ncbi:hypothetical protein IEQ34_007598 [Dendrobium chrysotoxum]|uniref:Uncharacterized protein n=1 Tax=Dendrobium chrysotoxum TaxID=161865 RepID=A0AAV7H1U8_DENCH|nr:hypothetical protein IEQ34_007598 [Dendrobium chrysotoxum]
MGPGGRSTRSQLATVVKTVVAFHIGNYGYNMLLDDVGNCLSCTNVPIDCSHPQRRRVISKMISFLHSQSCCCCSFLIILFAQIFFCNIAAENSVQCKLLCNLRIKCASFGFLKIKINNYLNICLMCFFFLENVRSVEH